MSHRDAVDKWENAIAASMRDTPPELDLETYERARDRARCFGDTVAAGLLERLDRANVDLVGAELSVAHARRTYVAAEHDIAVYMAGLDRAVLAEYAARAPWHLIARRDGQGSGELCSDVRLCGLGAGWSVVASGTLEAMVRALVETYPEPDDTP